ncbi:hypothetical protein K1T71_001853 [Dendrolimus kikuchii]|uniref:Uncharacterized protein n=1 Tax=Dendrolimus kikuchii TaxID=765133 RepID=A0ACC1DFE5_9NEOP|nr:hypothetical protein K1T71_001853 [Dendrolimus kikuchii]
MPILNTLIIISVFFTPYKVRYWRVSQNVLYGLGHFYNDLCATMWFSYMILFFQAIMSMEDEDAGALLLLGQIIDALATPLVGIFADKYGSIKCWHLTGCLIVTFTFPLLFERCWGCGDINLPTWWMSLYYAILVLFFQIGWAVVQISHLAMIPYISEDLQIRSDLTSVRYMASVISSLTVYFTMWMVLRTANYGPPIEPEDFYKFRIVSIIITAIGIVSYTIFHIFFKLREQRQPKVLKSTDVISNGTHSYMNEEGNLVELPTKSKIMYFLKMPLLYQTSFLYVFARLYWALSLVFVPLYLEERLSINPYMGTQLIASVPLVIYISSFFFTLLLKSRINSFGNQVAYLVGSILCLISSLWIAIGIDPFSSIVQIFLVATLIGAGCSIMLVSSLCITADLIGHHSHQGAAIYSIVTFADKLFTGIAIIIIQNYKSEVSADYKSQYYRGVLTYACGGNAGLGILCLMLMQIMTRCKSQNQTKL